MIKNWNYCIEVDIDIDVENPNMDTMTPLPIKYSDCWYNKYMAYGKFFKNYAILYKEGLTCFNKYLCRAYVCTLDNNYKFDLFLFFSSTVYILTN